MKILIAFWIIALLVGCSQTNTGNAIRNIPKEDIEEPIVYFCPGDDCEGLLAGYINNSQKSVHCAFYDLNLKKVLNALAARSKEIDVKIVIDNGNFDEKIGGKGVIYDNSIAH